MKDADEETLRVVNGGFRERKGEEERDSQVKNEEERGSRGKKRLTRARAASPRAARGVVCLGAFNCFLFRIFFCSIPRAMVECTVLPWYFENLDFMLTLDHGP